MILASVAILFSCAKDEVRDDTTQDQEETVAPEGFESKTFSASVSELTKAAFTGSKVNLAEGDLIAVYDGTRKNEFTVTSVSSGKAVIEGFVTEGSDEFYAVFPYSAASETLPADGAVSINLPEKQKVGNEIVDQNALISVAKADAVGHFQLRNAVSLVRLYIPGGATSVKFSSNGEAVNLSGAATVKIGEAASGALSSSVTLLPDGENTSFAAGNYWLSVLPVEMPQGYKIEYAGMGPDVDSDYTTSALVDLVRNTGMDITAETSDQWMERIFISTYDEFKAFMAAADNYDAENAILLEADIDMQGETVEPFMLKCQFDGQGYKIHNFVVEEGYLIADVAEGVTLENVVFGSSDGATYDGTSKIYLKDKSVTSLGIIGMNHGTVEKVSNFTPVSAELDGVNPPQGIGGLVGTNYNTVTACRNAGDISISGQWESGTKPWIGGIVGLMDYGAVGVANSVNTGNITANYPGVQSVAGIAGMLHDGNITECENSGELTIKDSELWTYCAGIAAFIQKASSVEASVISDCHNTGAMKVTGRKIRGIGGIAGFIHADATQPFIIRNCTNTGGITVDGLYNQSTPDKVGVGGIFGLSDYNNSTANSEISGCENSGNITLENMWVDDYTKYTVTFPSVGGVIGLTGNYLSLRDCKNSGDILATVPVARLGGVAGLVRDNVTISGNSSSGAVSLDLGEEAYTWDGVQVGIAGIIGAVTGTGSSVSGNTNSGAVSVVANTTSPLTVDGTIAIPGSASVSDNTNTGTVTK